MGCGASKEALKLQIDKAKQESSHHVALQSTGGLQLVLQQSVIRKLFRDFVIYQWDPCNEGNQFNTEQARRTAISCLEFWVEARDFSKIKKSPFRTYRAVYIFEQYLMHGACKQVCCFCFDIVSLAINFVDEILLQVPVSINVVDECVSTLFNALDNEEVEADVFHSAESEVLIYPLQIIAFLE